MGTNAQEIQRKRGLGKVTQGSVLEGVQQEAVVNKCTQKQATAKLFPSARQSRQDPSTLSPYSSFTCLSSSFLALPPLANCKITLSPQLIFSCFVFLGLFEAT